MLLQKVTSVECDADADVDVAGQPQVRYLLTQDDVIGDESGRTILLQQVSYLVNSSCYFSLLRTFL